MRILTRMFFCTFAIVSFYSCEPEEISETLSSDPIFQKEHDKIGETGDQKNDVYVKEDKD